MPAAHGLLDHVLDGRLVDDRQHLLGLRLGGRQEPGAEPGGGDDGLADRMCGGHAALSSAARSDLPTRTSAARPSVCLALDRAEC